MPTKRLSRRQFLKIAAITLGAGGLAYTGNAFFGSQQDKLEFTNSNYGDGTMGKKILVAYASRAGSTVGIANAIAQNLAKIGASVDVRQVETVTNLYPYDAVIVGSAIHGQKWLPEAMQFMRDHQPELSRKPFAAFMVCITLSMANADQYREGLKAWMSPVRDMVRPVSEGYFAGGLDFSKLPFSLNVLAMRFVALTEMWKEGDHRDWNAIHAWSNSLPSSLLQ